MNKASELANLGMIAIALMGCSGCPSSRSAAPCGPIELAQVPDGNFTLFVSNQSFAKPTVDVCVLIDGKVAVSQSFKVGQQHNWQTFVFNLPQGQHTLRAVSSKGKTELETEFSVGGKNWAVLDYVYSPESKDAKQRQRTLKFHIQDKPIGFV